MSTIQFIADKLAETGKTGTDMCKHLGIPRATLQNWKRKMSFSYMTRLKEIGKFLGVSVKQLKDAADEKEKEKIAPAGNTKKTGSAAKNEKTAGNKAEPTVNEKAKKTTTPVKPEEPTGKNAETTVKTEEATVKKAGATTAGKAKKTATPVKTEEPTGKKAEPAVNEKAKKASSSVKTEEAASGKSVKETNTEKDEPSSADLLAEMDKVFLALPYEAQVVLVNNAKLMRKV